MRFFKIFVFLIPYCGYWEIQIAMAGLNHFTMWLGYILLVIHMNMVSPINNIDRYLSLSLRPSDRTLLQKTQISPSETWWFHLLHNVTNLHWGQEGPNRWSSEWSRRDSPNPLSSLCKNGYPMQPLMSHNDPISPLLSFSCYWPRGQESKLVISPQYPTPLQSAICPSPLLPIPTIKVIVREVQEHAINKKSLLPNILSSSPPASTLIPPARVVG